MSKGLSKQLSMALKKHSNPEHEKSVSRFFKTAPGEYGHGDKFLGLTMPLIRSIIKDFYTISLSELQHNIQSEFHEERMAALLILVQKFKSKDTEVREKIYKSYVKNFKFINNWDLIDVTCPAIVGGYLIEQNKSIYEPLLLKWAKDKSMWIRRIAVLTTSAFIRQNNFTPILTLSKLLLNDKEDLMHKAVGWMLREVGKKDLSALDNFLRQHYHKCLELCCAML